jgi:hypothetical protein
MVAETIIKSLSAKDLNSQIDGIEQINTLLKNFDISSEPQLIQLISNLLEVSSDKTHQQNIEFICDDFIRHINPYSFETVFREISKVLWV